LKQAGKVTQLLITPRTQTVAVEV